MSENDFPGLDIDTMPDDSSRRDDRRADRRVHSVNVVTINPEDLTAEDIKNLKQIARYYSAGKLFLLLLLTMGFGAISIVDWLNSMLKHFKVQ